MSDKIIGFCQLKDEQSKGNLYRFADNMDSFCDRVYVFDQNSQDDSVNVYNHHNWRVIYSEENRFHEEIKCKQELLEYLYDNEGDCWALWLDGDSVLDCNSYVLSQLLYAAEIEGHDAVAFGHLNLWNDENHYRIDNNYMHLDDIGVIAAWKISDKTSFSSESGLHNLQYPATIRSVLDAREIKILHYGFMRPEDRKKKYELYKSLGQTGYDLERLLDESTLTLKHVR